MANKRDLDRAWRIVDRCVRDPSGSVRQNIAEAIAVLLAQMRAARKTNQ